MRVNLLPNVIDNAVVHPRDVLVTHVHADALRERLAHHDQQNVVELAGAARRESLIDDALQAFANGEHRACRQRETEHCPNNTPPVRSHERPHELDDGGAGIGRVCGKGGERNFVRHGEDLWADCEFQSDGPHDNFRQRVYLSSVLHLRE